MITAAEPRESSAAAPVILETSAEPFAVTRADLAGVAARLGAPAQRRAALRPVQAAARAAQRPAPAPIQRVKINGEDVKTASAVEELLDDEGQDSATLSAELASEAFDRLLASSQSYDSAGQLMAEVRLRTNIVAAMRALNQKENADYDHERDTLHMPDANWKGVPAYEKGKSKAADEGDRGAHAYTNKDGVNSSTAIDSVFADNDGAYALECNTAMLLAQYKGLLATLGAAKFDALAPTIAILREWSTLIPSSHAENQSEKLIPVETLAKGDEDDAFSRLIPGDGIYFVNYDDYGDVQPEGAFAGEWGVYLGGGKFTGFGVNELTFDEAVLMMIKQYNVDLTPAKKREAKMASRKDAVTTPTLDGKVPGVSRDVRRMAKNPLVAAELGKMDF